MPNVTMPNGDIVWFPDTVPPETINKFVEHHFPQEVRNYDADTGKKPYQNLLEGSVSAAAGMLGRGAQQQLSLIDRDAELQDEAAKDFFENRFAQGNFAPPSPAEIFKTEGWSKAIVNDTGNLSAVYMQPFEEFAASKNAKTPEEKQALLSNTQGRTDFLMYLMRRSKARDQKRQETYDAAGKLIPETDTDPRNPITKYVPMMAGSLADMAPSLVTGNVLKGTGQATLAALAPMFQATGATGYQHARELGADPTKAANVQTLWALSETLPEIFTFSKLFGEGSGSMLRDFVVTALSEGGGEVGTEGAQILIDKYMLNVDMTPEEIKQRLIDAGVVGAGLGVGMQGVQTGVNKLRDRSEFVPDDKAAPTTEKIVGSDFGSSAGADPGIAETLGNIAAQPKAITREKKLALPPPSAPEDVVSPIVPRQQTIALSPTEEQIAQKAADRTRATLNVAREVTTPVGSFSMDEVGPDVAGKVNLWRMRTGRQPDAPVTVADMKAAKVEPTVIDALVLTRKPLTGEKGLSSSTRPALESTVARTGPFTEEQYGAGVASVRTAGRFTLKGLQEATGTTPAAAKLIRDEMVKRGDLVEGARPGTFKPYVRPAAPSTQSPLKTHTVAPVTTDTITVKKDGKVFGVFEDQVAAKDAVRGIREREKAEQNPPSNVQIVRGGVDAEGKAMAERPAFAVYENRYDADGNIVDRAIVSTHVTEDAARAEADTLASRSTPVKSATNVGAGRTPPRPSVFARSRPQIIPTPKVVEGRLPEIVDRLNAQANRRALPLIGNRVQLVSAITDQEGEGGIEGSYLNQLIELSVENLDPKMSTDEVVEALAGVMDHETIHALRGAGVLAPGTRAWQVLSQYVQKAIHPKTGKTYLETAFDRNPELRNRPDVIVEEGIAEAFREWAANKRAVTGVPRTTLQKIVEWFKRLLSSIPEDVFRSIETGSLARSRITAPMSYRGKAVEMMNEARAKMEVAETPEEKLAAQRDYLQAREQAAEDRVGRVGPRTVSGTTPSLDYITGPRGSFDAVEELLDRANTDLKLAPTPNNGVPDPDFMTKLADAYDKAKHEPSNIAVSKAYSSLIAETKAIFNALNVTVVPWRENGQPYLNQREMLDDIANGKIVMRLSNELFPPHPSRRNHPMQEPSGITTADGTALSNNDLLRVVAEAYGYAPVGAVPSMLGDYRAYHTLKGMYSEQGQRALATEMLAQSAWHNAGPGMRLSDGSIAPPDALGYVPPNMREFAEQKATLLPPEALVEPPQEEIIDLSKISEGEARYSRVRNPQENTPEFKNFIANSKVVEPTGLPQVVYTGTSKDMDFTTFKAPKNGIWFTTDPADASGYAMQNDSMGFERDDSPGAKPWAMKKVNQNPRVIPVYLSIKNPYVVTDLPQEMLADNYKRAQGIFFDKLKAQGYDGFQQNLPNGQTIWVAFSSNQIKSAIGNVGTFDPSKKDYRYSKGVNKHGLAPYLRQPVDTTGMNLPSKPLFVEDTNNANAQAQIDRIKPVLDMFPDALKNEREWGRMMAYALASDDVPIAPVRLIKDLQDGTAISNLKKMTPGQIADANHGFKNAANMRAAYLSGAADIDVTGKLFLWSFLSRGVSPYTQEGLFIDAYNGIEPWLRYAARGQWDPTHTERYRYGTPEVREVVANYLYNNDLKAYENAKKDAEKKGKPFDQDMPRKIEWSENPDGTINLTYKQWARLAAPAGMGQPGAGASHNLNAFGSDFLAKMSQSAGDGTGRSRLRVIHDMMADPRSTGPAIRRKFMTMGEGVGIDNKVVSFTLLVAGFPDVMVLDRVQVRQLWNDGRFGDINLYDGVKENNKSVTGTALSNITYGARGLLIYEAIEREIADRMLDIYTQLGRPQDASIGRYHWDTWVTDSGQEASHGTLGAILPRQYGGDSLSAVTAKQGEYGTYAYGARYGVDGRGTSYFNYETPSGKLFTFSVPGFVAFQQEIKKPANKVVPPNFSVTGEKKNADGTKTKDNFNGPWYTRPEVNTRQLEALAAKYALGEAGSEPGTIRTSGLDAPIPDGLAARAYPADTDETRYSRGVKYGPAEQSRLPARNRGAGRYALGDLAPLAGAPQVKGAAGPDPRLVAVAEQYARDNGIELRRQAEYVKVDPDRARRVAAAYEAMPHAPQDPKVKEAYQDLIRQTIAQYRALEKAGYKFWFIDINSPEGQDYSSTPWNAMRDIRANQSMGVFPTATGFGTSEQFSPDANPLLIDTGIRWPWGSPDGPVQPVLANDLFRAVHDAFGHGIEGSGFRAEGEENAWQAHIRLFTGSAVGAITSETRGQNSWLNYGPYGETNRNAKVEDTVFADQKTGLMPEWTWLEGRAGDMGEMTAANSYNVGSPEFYAMLDEVTPGGKYYGDPKRSAAAVTVPADVSAPNFSQSMDGNAFFGGDIAYHQLQMTRDGDRGAVMTYMAPEDFLRLADQRPAREQALYDAAVADGYKFNTLPSLVVESGKAGTVPVLNSDGVAMVRALVGKVKTIPVVLYPSANGQIENISMLEANGAVVQSSGLNEFDIERRGPRNGLSSIAFNAWFKNSAVVDENGAPKRMYHNTKSDRNFDIFDTRMSEFGSHFGTVEQANERNEKGHGYPVYLSIQNPVRLVDEGEFDTFTVARQLYDQGIIDQRTYDNVRSYTVNGMVVLQDALIERGYDGVVYLNKREGVDVPNWSDWSLPDAAFKEKYPEAQDSYIVFQPTQVKSAIANRGTWSSADPDIRYSRSRDRRRVLSYGDAIYTAAQMKTDGFLGARVEGLARSKTGKAASIYNGRINFQDKALPFKEFVDRLNRNGVIVPATINAAIVEEQLGSAAAYQDRLRDENMRGPFIEAINKAAKAKRFDYRDMLDFLYARHASERNAYLRSLKSPVPNPSGMSEAEANEILSKLAARGVLDEMTALADKYVGAIVKDITDVRLASGMITPEQAAGSPYRNWVPLRDTEDYDPFDLIAKGPRADGVGSAYTSSGRAPDPKTYGRNSKAGDIIANLFTIQSVTLVRAERAKVQKAFYESMKLPGAQAVIGDTLVPMPGAKKRLAYGSDGMIREIVDPNFRKQPGVIVFKIDGKEVAFKTNDFYLERALKGPLLEPMNSLMANMSVATQKYTALITTRNPAFTLPNLLRDYIEALIHSGQYKVPGLALGMTRRLPSAIKAIADYKLNEAEYKKVLEEGDPEKVKLINPMARYYWEADKNGWLVSFLNQQDMTDRINRLHRDAGLLTGTRGNLARIGKATESFFNVWDGVNDVFEGATRLSFYAAVRDYQKQTQASEGRRDSLDAINEAGMAMKNLTINFNKGGRYKKAMNANYLFASVILNGAAATGKMLKSKRGQAVLGSVIGLAFVLDMLNRALSDDDNEDGVPDYDLIPEYELNRNLYIPVHRLGFPGITEPVKIPIALGPIGALFNFGRNASRALNGIFNPRQPVPPLAAAGRMITSAVDAINPFGDTTRPANLITPWYFDPVVDLAMNKNWADMDIKPPSYDETKPNSQRYYSTTDPIYIAVAQGLNQLAGGNEVRGSWFDFSPEQYKYIVDFALAGTGSFIMDSVYGVTEALPLALSGQAELIKPGKLPIVSRFDPTQPAERGARDEYFRLRDEVAVTKKELKSADQETRQAGRERVAGSSSVQGAFKMADKQLEGLRKMLRAAQENRTMATAARLAKIEEIRQKMDDVMAKAVKRYYDAIK